MSKFRVFKLAALFFCLSQANDTIASFSQEGSEQYFDEVALNFRYGAVVNTNIIALYDGNQFLIPIIEVFDILRINYGLDQSRTRISGFFIDESRRYQIDFVNFVITLDGVLHNLTISDMHIGELDYYVTQTALNDVFDIEFIVDFSTLSLRLISLEKLPVLILLERTIRREQMLRGSDIDVEYDLLFPRNNNLARGFFTDYSITQSYSSVYSYDQFLIFGGELLGGDIQGNYSLRHGAGGTTGSFSSTRWRHVWPQSRVLSQLFLGELSSDGLTSQRYYGTRLTNDRVLPRRTFDTYRYIGRAQPQSEVEIYLNDRLIDFQIANEFGDYTTDIPLNFGSSDIRVVTIAPSGEIQESVRRFQIPFTFMPQGEFVYFANAGLYERLQLGDTSYNQIYQGSAAYGLASWLTLKSGFDLIENDQMESLWYNQINFRVFDQYLFNADIAPSRYYRLSGNVLYPNGSSFNFSATEFDQDGFFNRSRLDRQFNATAFLAFYNFRIPFGTRFSYDYSEFDIGSTIRYSGELNMRLGRINLRSSVRHTTLNRASSVTNNTRLISSATYTLARTVNVPTYLRGTFVRAQMEYSVQQKQLETIDTQLSRQVMSRGRLDINFSRNMNMGINLLQIGFTYDFNFARSTTRVRVRDTDVSFTNSFRGTVMYDSGNNRVITDFRQSVGRSAVAFRLFIDENNNGVYDQGEELLDDQAVRIRRASTFIESGDQILRFTQLQQYERYHVEINKAAIRMPMLVPLQTQFSFVADPNQFKVIDIPLYYSGVIEGNVFIAEAARTRGLGGVRLYLERIDNGSRLELRTFADGLFYADEIDPAKYKLYPDPNQLEILGAVSFPEYIEFEVMATSMGDFVEGLEFTFRRTTDQPSVPEPVIPAPPVIAPPVAVADPEPVAPPVTGLEPSQLYRVQIAMMPTLARAMIARERVERLLNHPAEITLSNHLNMYRVLTRDIDDLQTATQMLSIVSRETEHRDAYMLNSVNYLLSDVTYAVQIGAFRNSAAADRHAEQARSRFGLDVHSFYHEISGWFVVQTREFTNWREAILLRDRIRSTTSYTDAFTSAKPPEFQIFSSYSVQVGAYSRLNFALQQAEAFSRRTGLRFEVVFNPVAGLYTVRLTEVPSLQQAEQLLRQLLEVHGFEEGLILSLETAVR
jgi:hypothetical protein